MAIRNAELVFLRVANLQTHAGVDQATPVLSARFRMPEYWFRN